MCIVLRLFLSNVHTCVLKQIYFCRMYTHVFCSQIYFCRMYSNVFCGQVECTLVNSCDISRLIFVDCFLVHICMCTVPRSFLSNVLTCVLQLDLFLQNVHTWTWMELTIQSSGTVPPGPTHNIKLNFNTNKQIENFYISPLSL